MLKKLLLTGCMLLMTTHAFAADNPHVVINTSFGEFELELEAEKAPITVNNFLDYVDAERYYGTIFHRVFANFIILCGGFEIYMHQKSTKSAIHNKTHNVLTIKRGTVTT